MRRGCGVDVFPLMLELPRYTPTAAMACREILQNLSVAPAKETIAYHEILRQVDIQGPWAGDCVRGLG